jgi:hypothetical protein
MKKILPLFLLVLTVSCSNDLGNMWSGGWAGIIPTIPHHDIPGNYQGDILYWANSQDYIDSLSQEGGYQMFVTENSDGGFTIAFDSTFVYVVPNFNFLVNNIPDPNTIKIDEGQAYMDWFPHGYAGHFYVDTLGNQSQIL